MTVFLLALYEVHLGCLFCTDEKRFKVIKGMRIGLFGGTFNPVHNGHLEIAAKLIETVGLDSIIFIPSNLPPHKGTGVLADAADRMEMIRLSLPADARYRFSDIEVNRTGPSYTIDTICSFVEKPEKDADYYLLMGLDAFLEIHTWKSFESILTLIQTMVVFRKGDWNPDKKPVQKVVESYIKTYISESYSFSSDRSCLLHPDLKAIHVVMVDPVDISSTMVRKAIKDGGSITPFVPYAVAQYIKEKGLYL